MGAYAADLLAEGHSNRVVAYKDGEYKDFDIDEALKMQKDLPDYVVRVAKAMSI
jgi:6-phosphofructokinase 1